MSFLVLYFQANPLFSLCLFPHLTSQVRNLAYLLFPLLRCLGVILYFLPVAEYYQLLEFLFICPASSRADKDYRNHF